jgi:hypothetical protein
MHMRINLRAAGGWKTAAAVSGLALAGLAASVQASANCGAPPAKAPLTPSLYAPAARSSAGFIKTAFVPAFDVFDNEDVVGLWEFEVHLNGAQNGLPDDFLIDWGLATWHADGSEIQFSAGRPPDTGDVCMGVWKPLGHNTFQLNHIALGLGPVQDGAAGTFSGATNIRATVTVDQWGKTFKGRYSIIQYSGSPADGTEFSEKGTPQYTFVGTITAHRVTADY